MRILVIDDESEFRAMLSEWLVRQGHDVRGAAGGPETMEVLARTTFDVVLLDLVMPKVNGLTLISRIRQDFPLTHVIVISGVANIRVAVETARAGAQACFEKPIDFPALQNELTRLNRVPRVASVAPGLSLQSELRA